MGRSMLPIHVSDAACPDFIAYLDIMKLMHELGADVAQGDYLAPALPAGDLLAEFPLVSDRARSRIGRFAVDLTDAKSSLTEATSRVEDPSWGRR